MCVIDIYGKYAWVIPIKYKKCISIINAFPKMLDESGCSEVYNRSMKSWNNKENPKFKIGDHVRISKYKNIFAKGYVSNWLEEIFIITEIRITMPWTYVIKNLNGKEIIEMF